MRLLERHLSPSRGTVLRAASLAVALSASSTALAAEPFSYNPPGMLVMGSGEGRYDEHVYAPNIRFPIENTPAFLNSQVWGHGGSQGPGGGQCDPENRQYPWWDNYCETRTWDMPLCPSGTGHQGQDIRASDCDKDKHWVVAATDGTITNVGSYSVYLTAEDGTRFDYLHMSNVQVAFGDEVTRGQPLGTVSNVFGGTPTTIHLHFNIKQDIDGIGFVFVPTYMSLIASYQALINTEASGVLESVTCDRVRGASFDPDTPELSNSVLVSAGPAGDPSSIAFDVPANQLTDALCDGGAAECARGFDTLLPIRLLDGKRHDIHVAARDTWVLDAAFPLSGSPGSVTCQKLSLEDRERRAIRGESVFANWRFSLFFDELARPAVETDSLPEGEPLTRSPELVTTEDKSSYFILDGGALRPVSEDAMFAFRFDPDSATVWSPAEIDETPEGRPWPSRAAIVKGNDKELYLLDEAPPPALDPHSQSKEDAQKALACACRTTQATGQWPTGGAGTSLAVTVFIFVCTGLRRILRVRPKAVRR